jgi:hypothetical protein
MPISKELFDSIDKDGGFASAAPAKASSKGDGSGGDMVDSFIAEASPIAEQISKKIGVSPHIVMAQMALETGWGKSIVPGTNNWGNIKDFTGNGVAATDNQTGSRDKYRAFGSGAEYADAASDLLARKYKNALGAGDNALAYATALKQGGYAEDRDYVAKNVRIADMLKKRLGSSNQWSDDKAIRHDDGRPGAQSKTEALRAGLTAGDLVKTFGASAVSGIGDMGQGLVGEPLAWLANKAAGTEEFEGKNLLAGVSDSIREGLTAGGQMARQDAPTGDIFQPETWKLPETTGGLLMIGADGLGSLVPSILPFAGQAGKAASLAKAAHAAELAGDAAKASQLAMQSERASNIAKAAGAAGGFGMTGGAAAGEVRQNVEREIQGRSHEDLMKSVPLYRDAFAQTGDERTARKAVVNGAAQYATLFSGAMGAVGGGINAKLLEDVIVKRGVSSALGKLSGNAAVRSAVGAAAGGIGEGFQEVTEKVGQNAGENVGLGRPAAQNVSRDSFGDFLGGAMVGGPVGGLGGGASLTTPRAATPQLAQPTIQPNSTTPAQPVIQSNSPLANAAGIAQAAAPQPAAADPFDGRLSAMQSFVEDKAFIQALRGDPRYGKESVTDLLSAWAKARNPNLDPKVRERALSDIEGFSSSFVGPNTLNSAGTTVNLGGNEGVPPGTQVAPFQQPGGAVGPAITPDDGRTLNGETITRPSTMAGANPNQISAPPVLGLPTEEALQAKRDADAAYEQAYHDLVKAESLGASDQDLAARQQAIREARAAREQADARMQDIERAIEGSRAQQTTEKRRTVLDAILADPATVNPAARLAAELKRQGFRDTTPTQAELDTIQRFSDIKSAEAEPDIIPSSPNELDPYQVRQERPRQPSQPRLTVEQIKEAIANGATLSKDVLTLPDSSRVKLKGPQIAAARQALAKKAQAEQPEIAKRATAQMPVQAKPNAAPSDARLNSLRRVNQEATPAPEQQPVRRLTPQDIRGHIDSGAVLGDGALTFPDGSRLTLKGPQIAAARQAQIKKARTEPAKPAPVEPMPTAAEADSTSTEQEAQPVDPLDKEISDAAAHLADVLADVFGAKLNITGPQHSAADLLPAMQKVIGLLIQKGFKTFSQAVGQTARMLRDNGAGDHVEKITPRQWKAAYQFAADMPGVDGAESEEAVAALSADKVLAIVSGQVDKAKAEAEARTDTNPSDAQKAAENYRKGKFAWNGQTISVENPKGSERTGKGEDGAEWRTVMPATYGYFLGTVGADKDHVDVFMGDTLDAPSFWVINQTQPDSAAFDEHKVVAGVTSADEAKRIYLDSFSDGFGDKVFSSIAGPYPVGELADVLPKLKAKKPSGVKKESPRDAHIRAKEEAYTARREGQPVPPKALAIVRTEAGKEFDKAESTHKDPGQPAEAVTPAVVAESIRKSAANTPLDVKGAKAYLLAEIDKAILAAGDKSELEAELAHYKSQAYEKDVTRSAGTKEFRALRDNNIAKTVAQIGFVTFDVPGDGKFKVANSAAKLQEFRRKVETSPGFKNPATKLPIMRSETSTGSYGPRDAILEGDYLNAYELAKLQDRPLVFSAGTAGKPPSVYTDASTADGIIDNVALIVARYATKDGKWFVIEPATGLLMNKNGLPSKVAALTATKARTKGREDEVLRLLADPAKAMPQSTLEAEWLAWAEKEEGVTPEVAVAEEKSASEEDGPQELIEPEESVSSEPPSRIAESVTPDADLASIFKGLSSRGLAKVRARKAAAAHQRAAQIAYVQENFMDILTELEDSGLVNINCD